MQLHVIALNPTDSVTAGFLPAAAALGLDVTVFTDHPDAHRKAYAGTDASRARIAACDVRDFRTLIAAMAEHPGPDAVFSNSDHLQTQTALAAAWFGLPGKDWRATLRAKNKALMRRHLADHGADVVWHGELPAGRDVSELTAPPFPCVVKPREGVASEDVYLVADAAELRARVAEIRGRTPDAALVVEEYLPGELRTLETLGDAAERRILGGFRTRLSAPPTFIEEALVFDPDPPAALTAQVTAQLDTLGIGFGACHTEYVDDGGRARLIEVNYRIIGDQCDLMLRDLLDVPLFADVLRVHLGEPLPARPRRAAGDRARVEYVCADAAGTLVAAPGPLDLGDGGVRMTYRPLRELGETAPLTGTNRDYLGVLRAIGPTQAAVDRATARFLAAHRWEIRR